LSRSERGENEAEQVEYPLDVKARMVRRMTGPDRVTATELAMESGIPQPTLSRWLREAGMVAGVSESKGKSEAGGAPKRSEESKRPQDYSALERARVVLEGSGLGAEGLGELLRRRGVHREVYEQWREALEAALTKEPKPRRGEGKRIRELEKELARKDKALAETAALLVLKKKWICSSGRERTTTREGRAGVDAGAGRRGGDRRSAPGAGMRDGRGRRAHAAAVARPA